MIRSTLAALSRLAVILCVLFGGPVFLVADEEASPVVRWEEFSTAAFERAGKEGKLVFLSILSPWGHWDRLMEETTFTDPVVISLLNERYVPVRVDPLARPDINARYTMGGWPTSTFLLPGGQPFLFPGPGGQVVRAGGKFYASGSLAELLQRHADYFTENREAAEALAEDFALGALSRHEVGDKAVGVDLVEVCISRIIRDYGEWWPDPRIKKTLYPDSDSIDLGLAYSLRNRDTSVRDLSMRLLTDMARGGIRDQLGGGFHRYATDAAWRVPAFEKTLDVNARLLATYGAVSRLTGNERYEALTGELAGYVLNRLRDPQGWFYAYQASDTPGTGNGDYYTWTLKEVRDALNDDELRIIVPAFDIGEWGEMVDSAPRRNVLFVFDGPFLLSQRFGIDFDETEATFDEGRAKMLEVRNKRTAPPIGHVLVTDANATMSSSLTLVGSSWGRPDLVEAGLAALDFLWTNLRDPRSGLMDHYWTPGSGKSGRADLFADQVRMTQALITAYEVTGSGEYLKRARELAQRTATTFADSLNGGYMDRIYSPDLPGLLSWPNRSIQENARFAEALISLGRLGSQGGTVEGTDELDFGKEAREALEAWGDDFQEHGTAASRYGLAVLKLETPPVELLIAASPDDGKFTRLRDNALTAYHPWRVVRYLSPAEAAKEVISRGVESPSNEAAAYICRSGKCTGPFDETAEMEINIKEFLEGGEMDSIQGAAQESAGQ